MSDKLFKLADINSVKPGKMERFVVEGKAILLCHVDDEFYALSDVCSHEEASLYRGSLKERCVTCPMHGARFDIQSGAPLDEPATEAVATYPLVIKGEEIYILLDD